MKNMKIGWRLGLGFGGVLLLLVAILALGIYEQGQVKSDLDRIVLEESAAMDLSSRLALEVGEESRLLRSLLLFDDAQSRRSILDRLSDLQSKQSELTSELKSVIKDPQLDSRVEAISDSLARYDRVKERLLERVEEGEPTSILANFLEEEVRPMGRDVRSATEELKADLERKMEADYQHSVEAYNTAVTLLSLLGGIALVLGISMAWLIGRSITTPINEAVEAARAVARGDLSSDLRSDRKDELGQLLNALADMRNSLREIVTNIREGVETINTASGEIATGNTDLSSRTEEQASSLEETASSMEEMTSTVRQNADNAQQANKLARTASDNADRGGNVVEEVVKHMAAIKDSSKKMSEIISVIDGIAFQTNILALNAAVEAARAGEQGRGFAVVAGEVRSLAQRSASAAKDIKELIEESVEGVNAGSELVDKAGDSMEEIVGSIKKVTDIIGEISAASQEQSSGIEQINEAVTQMDQVTQQNAALVEEAAAAAESLQSQAEELDVSVARFKLSEHDDAARKIRSKPAKPAPAARPAQSVPKTETKASAARSEPAKPKPQEPAVQDDDDWEEF